MADRAYKDYQFSIPELPHEYGGNVHLLADPVLLTLLGRLCRPETLQPEVTWLIRDIYETLVRLVIANELPRRQAEVRTRMFASTSAGVWSGSLLDPNTRVVTVNIARAGMQPSQVAFETLTRLLNPDVVRQDHIYMSRVTDASDSVVGVDVAGNKIGGDVNDATVLLPDPMGATGGSIVRAANMYKNLKGGPAKKIVAAHLVVTPEYLKRVHDELPELVVYAVRLDRGLSAPDVLETGLGERWDEEKGLNERQYIVPGAGGLGEILNNSYV
ncbi:MAG: uracil phosphoribosyltransferase [Deltaproteobacteria bacterium RIFOXYA12_FULL_58_15]|nr:MAG: uracil phosphoribosyltransferase [Deltaproteobacteria bacterium RIFOXYA12_FULL_58_15]OGR10009.1 MAG: uracil phosphoribosyltransferase [Deltaproteobacteria bacterium RIFOXYB12_FULL_58_9]